MSKLVISLNNISMGNKKSKYAVVDGKTKCKRSQKTNHPLQVLQVSSCKTKY